MMSMFCDALLGHDDGVKTIANRARAVGATEVEIAEKLGVTFVMGGTPALVMRASAYMK